MNDIQTLKKQALLYQLIDSLRAKGNWCGETHVQKTAFFLDELTNGGVGYSFVLYKHGPFSFELSEDLSVMDARQFVEDQIVHPSYGPRLKTNPAGQVLLKEFGELASGLKDAAAFVVDKLADCGVGSLERYGTALYFTRKEPVGNYGDRAKRIHETKPHISETQALDAVMKVEAILNEWSTLQKRVAFA